ncbi:hypothetical protein DFH09DRAFT_1270714 [Mycena vulgaris]|nr:hypothetical protein DFH09DRAFT_1270714 [Mycena vulgaris]
MALAWLCLALAQHFPSQGQSQQQARPGQSQWLKPGLERKIFAQQFLRFWGPDEFLGVARSGRGLTGLAWLEKSQARSQGQGHLSWGFHEFLSDGMPKGAIDELVDHPYKHVVLAHIGGAATSRVE